MNATIAESRETKVEEYANHIDGEWRRCTTDRTFDDVNPADTRDVVGRFQASTREDAKAAVDAAARAFDDWRRTPIGKRASRPRTRPKASWVELGEG